MLFIAASATGLVFPEARGAEPRVVRFEVGLRLSDSAGAAIAAVADAALDAPATLVLVTGHTGPEGDPEANLTLSRERAEVVAEALRAAGLPGARILARGAGGSVPPQAGTSARRAEIRVVERRLLSAAAGS
ncbi:OmpA family protein [Pseudoponticoccus marisrubri]|uniref:OmpA-like domain-containing protein n=1 Tax=Pseudoponticoccus marisrubri TaxID=1685382 RepID=A0A0W7WDN0_9RHOB|nr:OmpA family protein [Pseudoponticoccus marisrubri]KUF08763.1 hypothetical protein AVJ23_21190 [Pseudoponticoccus marisrubri]